MWDFITAAQSRPHSIEPTPRFSNSSGRGQGDSVFFHSFILLRMFFPQKWKLSFRWITFGDETVRSLDIAPILFTTSCWVSARVSSQQIPDENLERLRSEREREREIRFEIYSSVLAVPTGLESFVKTGDLRKLWNRRSEIYCCCGSDDRVSSKSP